MARTSVGILRGGTSNEYPLSLGTGAAMLQALPDSSYDVRDIFIDKKGYWHLRGMPVPPARALSQIDVVLNALHGGVGEDGTVQRLLDRAGIPYAGANTIASALALNKIRAREVLRANGVAMPRAVSFSTRNGLTTADMAKIVFAEFAPPYVIKPPTEGAAHGIVIATTIIDLPDRIGDVLDRYGSALVEEYAIGEHVSVAIVESYRGEDLYAFPPAQVIKPNDFSFMHPRAHEEGILRHLVPSPFSHSEKGALAEIARQAHRALGIAGFSRADIILSARGPILLEVNTTPGLYKGASLPPMLESVGSSIRELLEHMLHLSKR